MNKTKKQKVSSTKPTGTPPIYIKGLDKYFGKTQALKNLNLKVNRGEIHGFLGPNGAGKSTTIRVLLGLLRKDSGEVKLLDSDPWDESVSLHRRLAYIPGEVNLWPNLSGGESIDLLASLRGGVDQSRRAELIERFKLDPAKKFRTYSKGNRQKVAIIAALVSDVELYLFDEPTSGLDPLMEAVFQEYVKQLADEGKTVLLSSHILAEVEKLCDRVSIIREGEVVETGTLSDLRHLTRTHITATTKKPLTGLDGVEGVHSCEVDGLKVEVEVDTNQIEQTLEYLMGFGISNLTSNPPTLSELFMRHYSGEAPDGK